MNVIKVQHSEVLLSFRPQQGLTIMNPYDEYDEVRVYEFPSPTGVNYYE